MENEKDCLNRIASQYFGIEYLFPYQRLVISNILAAAGGGDEAPDSQIVILPTGYGKSLCYMLPAVILEKPSIVLSPLLGLIKDQARRLDKAGIPYSTLTGALDSKGKKEAVGSILNGKSRILLTNPETLKSCSGLFAPDSCGNVRISHLVVDEAHTVPQWGTTFRSALAETGSIISSIKPLCVTAFTATASPPLLGKIREMLFGNIPVNIIAGNPDRPNIFYSAVPSLCLDRDTARLAGENEKPLIIFCRSRTDAELTARMLRRKLPGTGIFFYHAGLEKAEKESVEKWFLSSDNGILAATCAYGMGIDKPDIRTVIHRNPPGSPEAYLQEAGRAGRDGLQSKALLLFEFHQARKQSGEPAGNKADCPGRAAGGRSEPSGPDLPEWINADEEKGKSGKLQSCVKTPEQEYKNIDMERASIMEEYALNTTTCRRSLLLSVFTGDLPYCTGCDICAGNSQVLPDGFRQITAAVRDNRKLLDSSSLVSILGGETRDMWHMESSHYSAMELWSREQIKEAVDMLERVGYLKKGRYLWKGLYTLPGDIQ